MANEGFREIITVFEGVGSRGRRAMITCGSSADWLLSS
jgi:hypothetical protein